MIPLDSRITFLHKDEILMGDVWSNSNPLCVAVETDNGKVRYAVPLDDVHEIFLETAYVVIMTNITNGKTTTKVFYDGDKADAYYGKVFEKDNIVASFKHHTVSSWVFFQKSKW